MLLNVGPQAAEQVGERVSPVGDLGDGLDGGGAGGCGYLWLVGECSGAARDRWEGGLRLFLALSRELLVVQLLLQLLLSLLLFLVDAKPCGGRGEFANVFGEAGTEPVLFRT